jgi:hypothetical protein
MEFLRLLFGNFGEVLGKLLTGYIGYGWPFALMHALVLFSVIYHTWLRKIRVEAKALKDWKPELAASSGEDAKADSGGDAKAETTSILNLFVEESKALGPQGFLVPITDFSDRVDSIIDGLVSELHDRINLFLLVGIAGTLFGLFEFAFRAYDAMTSQAVDPNDRIRLLGEYLSLSMSKAFPVGFMGLVLTFIFQIIAAFPERKLRQSLSEATRKALGKRREESKSQASVVLESAAAIRDSLKPLNDLKLTLTESIQPVVKEFGTRLDQSLGLVKTQFDETQKTTASLKGAVDSVNRGVVLLNTVADSLKSLLQNAPAVLDNTIKLQQSQMDTLKDFGGVLDGYIDQSQRLNYALNGTMEKLNDLPADLIRVAKPMLENLGADSLEVWRNSSKEFNELISHDYDIMFEDISARVEQVQKQVISISEGLQTVTGNLSTAINALTGLPASIGAEIKTTFTNLGAESKNSWVTMSNQFGRDTQAEYVNYLAKIQGQAKDASDKLKEGAEEFGRVAGNWEQLLKEPVENLINDAKKSISDELKRLDQALVERYPAISSKIETFNNNLGTMLGQIQSIQAVLTQWIEGAEKAQKKVHDIHEGLVIADLLKNNFEQLQEANRLLVNIQKQMPRTGDGVQTDITESRRLLSEIRVGIDKLANRKGLFGKIRDRF